ncbi:MAG: hypothetical protein LBS00_11125, partial [Synergistaceae bacterium]|nr:hypothetical protein [Synergistaceae bacterium]
MKRILAIALLLILLFASNAYSFDRFLTATEIRALMNKYVQDRPVAQIQKELGKPWMSSNESLTWLYRQKIMIAMHHNPKTKSARLRLLSEMFFDDLDFLRKARFAKMTSDFTKILGKPAG